MRKWIAFSKPMLEIPPEVLETRHGELREQNDDASDSKKHGALIGESALFCVLSRRNAIVQIERSAKTVENMRKRSERRRQRCSVYSVCSQFGS